MNLPRSRGGNLTFQTEGIPEDHRQEGAEEGNHLVRRGCHQAGAEEEEEEGHSHYLGKHLSNLLKNS